MYTPRWLRGSLVAVTAMSMTLCNPSESHAIFHWFRRSCGTTQRAFSIAPTCASMACGPQPVVASYVPQTCFRAAQVSVPVTTFRPVVSYRPVVTYQQTTSCDPCTGCPVICQRPVTTMQPFTTMQPVQSCAQRTVMVPYTTYQIVYSTPAVVAAPATTVQFAQPACSACTTTGFAPSAGCSTCAQATVSAPAATYTTPSTTTVPSATQPMYGQPAYTQPGYTQPGYTQPSLSPSTAVPGYTTQSPVYNGQTYTAPANGQGVQVYSQPAQGYVAPPATVTNPATEAQRPATTPAPANGNGTNGTTTPMAPIPDAQTGTTNPTNHSSMPWMADPNNRTTALEHDGWVKHVAHTHAAPAAVMAVATYPSAVAPRVSAADTAIDADGWQAASR